MIRLATIFMGLFVSGLAAGELSLRVDTTGPNAFSFPSPVLDRLERRAFSVGNSFFKDNWVPSPASTTGRDGLGPRFNARSCSACHLRDGRAAPPVGEFAGQPGLVFTMPEKPPVFGSQLQDRAVPSIEPEATVTLSTQTVAGTFDDGARYELVRFILRVSEPDLKLSPRIGPPVIGLGLLESISEKTLRQHADPGDTNDDGISGRLNMVDGKPGRFGWKAEQPSVESQVAKALHEDMGLTTPLFPKEAAIQGITNAATYSGGNPEVDAHKLQRIVFYTQHLAVPKARPSTEITERGQALFTKIGCAACHLPEVQLGGPEEVVHPGYTNRVIDPYTDLLLHDMGDDLADASGSEWRTPPLWGIGRVEEVNGHTRFLHDGRARNLEEAVLWHGGEAEASQKAFKALEAAERKALIAFLRSL